MATVADAQTTAVTFEDNVAAAQIVGGKASFTGPTQSTTVKDRTTLEDAKYTVKAPGLIDPGQVTIECFRDPSDAGQAAIYEAMDSRATREMVVTFSDSSVITVQCFVVGVDDGDAAVSDDVKVTFTFEVTGAPVLS